MKDNGLIITAAGQGTRFNDPKGKLFVLLKGKPVLIHTCEKFLEFNFKQKVISVEVSRLLAVQSLLATYGLDNYFKVVPGGATRMDSVKNAFQELSGVKSVFIHDAARPNITADLIKLLEHESLKHKAVIPGIPVTDTIKQVEGSFVKETIPRTSLRSIQTPQVFDYALLKAAYQVNIATEITDEAMLIESLDEPIRIVPGDKNNLKITTPDDLSYLEWLLNRN